MLKKTFAVLGTLALALTLASCGEKGRTDADLIKDGWVKDPVSQGYVKDPEQNGYVKAPAALPAPQDTSIEGCEVGDFSYKCSSIQNDKLRQYMGRDDVVYIDLRGIDNGYSVGHIRGFESIEYFNFIQSMATTETAESKQLFYANNDANVAKGIANKPRYEESVDMLHELFPQDKALFLMCASGGRVKSMMSLLKDQGYDMTKVYNVGGMQQLNKEGSSVEDLVAENTLEVNFVVDYFKTKVVNKDTHEVTYEDIKLTPIDYSAK